MHKKQRPFRPHLSEHQHQAGDTPRRARLVVSSPTSMASLAERQQLVIAISDDSLCDADGEVCATRQLLAELGPKLGRVDGIAAVLAGPATRSVEVVLGTAMNLHNDERRPFP